VAPRTAALEIPAAKRMAINVRTKKRLISLGKAYQRTGPLEYPVLGISRRVSTLDYRFKNFTTASVREWTCSFS
jgi:hypothetical protein